MRTLPQLKLDLDLIEVLNGKSLKISERKGGGK